MTLSYALQAMNHNTGNNFKYTQANQFDQTNILGLMACAAQKDADKLVVLPEKFRAAALAETLEHKKMFIAIDPLSENIVGYKKLFIPDQNELNEILEQELRCIGPNAQIEKTGIFIDDTFVEKKINLTCLAHENDTLFIYNGGDFTHMDYRKRGISLNLTDYALSTLIPEIEKREIQQLVLIYGITESNAGKTVGDKNDRTHYILRSFKKFIQTLQENKHYIRQKSEEYQPLLGQTENEIIHARFKSYKPSFDPKSKECRPLPNDKSVPGYGCILSCRISQPSSAPSSFALTPEYNTIIVRENNNEK